MSTAHGVDAQTHDCLLTSLQFTASGYTISWNFGVIIIHQSVRLVLSFNQLYIKFAELWKQFLFSVMVVWFFKINLAYVRADFFFFCLELQLTSSILKLLQDLSFL